MDKQQLFEDVYKRQVFSDLNNLIDISMDEQYVELCGITEKEIHDNMEEDLHILSLIHICIHPTRQNV